MQNSQPPVPPPDEPPDPPPEPPDPPNPQAESSKLAAASEASAPVRKGFFMVFLYFQRASPASAAGVKQEPGGEKEENDGM
jgi:hypothetical protein